MALTVEEVSSRYPIHWLAWNNQHEELQAAIESKKVSSEDIELRDPRGRTPLLLAVTLGHIETVRVLLDAGADVNCEKDGWTAVQEATATGDIDLLSLVLSRRDHQRYLFRSRGIPDLLNRLSLAPDFYVEMKWQFTSWMPLISRVCPSDTYKVYKRGANVRVDTTLIGFENRSWLRGDTSYIFKGQGTAAKFMEVNHEAGTVSTEVIDGTDLWPNPVPRMKALRRRLEEPLAINYLDTDKISFERNKCGIWGWRQDKTETVNNYECKVFSANNVEIVSKTRCEHLPAGARRTPRPPPIAGLLGLDEPKEDLALPLLQTEDELKNSAQKFGGKFETGHAGTSSEFDYTKEQVDLTKEKTYCTKKLTDPTNEQIDPAKGQTDPTKGQTVSTKGQTNSTKGQTDPTKGQTNSSKGQTVSTKRQTNSTKGQTDPTKGQTNSTKGQTDPTKGQTNSTKGQTDPTKGQTNSTKGLTDPTKGQTNFTKGQTDLTKRQTNSTKGQTDPTKGQTNSTKGKTDTTKGQINSTKGQTDRTKGHTYSTKGQTDPTKGQTNSTKGQTGPTKEQTGPTKDQTTASKEREAIKIRNDREALEAAMARMQTPLACQTSYIQQLGGPSTGVPPKTIWNFRREKSFKNKSKNKKPKTKETTTEESDESSTDEDDIGKSVYSELPELMPKEENNDSQEEDSSGSESEVVLEATVPDAPVTWQEYFSGEPMRADIGRRKDMTTKVQKFKATLSLCEDYPLELQEQIMPILDLMTAIASPHFAKLKDFIQMQLPSGFPVKIEIPLFHVMNARITFGNIFATETPVPLVESIQEGDRLSCVIDDACFDIGRGYKDAGSDDRLSSEDGEEGLLQYAIQQSLMEAGTHEDQVDVWEALRGARPASPAPPRTRDAPQDLLAHEERQLQRAIEASLASLSLNAAPTIPDVGIVGPGVGESDLSDVDADLQAALALSVEEQSAIKERMDEEQRALDEALRLSLLDK